MIKEWGWINLGHGEVDGHFFPEEESKTWNI